MPRPPLIVIADDLTGAAEIAALAHRHGLSAAVVARGHRPNTPAEVLVFNTDSRLDSGAIAAAKVAELVPAVLSLKPALIFKKPDSVLRGPVRAELQALAAALGLARILLVPANPSLGRTVRAGRYAINGTALHLTAFGRDPHHPANSDEVCELLGPSNSLAVHSRSARAQLPASGCVIGDAADLADLDAWAALADDRSTLLAGAADFFAALLRRRGHIATPPPTPATRPNGPTLIISGTTHPGAAAARLAPAHVIARPVGSDLDCAAWAAEIRKGLAVHGVVGAHFAGPISADPTMPSALRRAFAQLAQTLAADQAFSHLAIEGGATAAAITAALGWHELHLLHAWAPGVASLRPVAAPHFTLTLKPGSYPWPAALFPFLHE